MTSFRNRAALGLLGVALTAAVGVRMTTGGTDEATAVSAAQSEAPAPDADPVVEDDLAVPDGTFNVVVTRDPFDPVVADADAAAGNQTEPVTAAATTELVDIVTDASGTRALVSVDGAAFTVVAGDVFAAGYRVLELTDSCITLEAAGSVVTHCDPDAVDGTTSPSGSPAGGGTCSGTDEVVCDGRVVTLVDAIDDARATVAVDAVRYDVVHGSVFADDFEVTAITPTCVSVAYGSDDFRLCEAGASMK